MPVMDGCDATIRIRKYLANLKIPQPVIIAVTGHTEEQYVKRAIESGMNGVSAKPLDQYLIKQAL